MMKAVIKSQRWNIFWVVFPQRANVTPVFKADAKDVVENYRSFHYYPFRINVKRGSCIMLAVYSHVAPYLKDWQNGLVRGRSCATQFCHTINGKRPWMRANRWTLFCWTLQGHLTEWCIISCCKKLGNFGISGAILNWCKSYLTNREQRTCGDRSRENKELIW